MFWKANDPYRLLESPRSTQPPTQASWKLAPADCRLEHLFMETRSIYLLSGVSPHNRRQTVEPCGPGVIAILLALAWDV